MCINQLWFNYTMKQHSEKKENADTPNYTGKLQMCYAKWKVSFSKGHILYNNVDLYGILSSLQFSCSVMSSSLWLNGLQDTRLPCSSPTAVAYSNSCPSSWWCHPTISSSVIPYSSCPQSFPGSGSFPMSQFFASGGQSIGVSASAIVLSMNIQDQRLWPT